jgi:hypothetical protein
MGVDEARVEEIKGQLSQSHFKVVLIVFNPAKLRERQELIRESWVKAMEVRLVRDELAKCHQAEGVNHYENCAWLSQKYLNMLRENRVRLFFLFL